MNEYDYGRLTPEQREYLIQLHIESGEITPPLPDEERCRLGWDILDRARRKREQMEGREIGMPEMFDWAKSAPTSDVLMLADGDPAPDPHPVEFQSDTMTTKKSTGGG